MNASEGGRDTGDSGVVPADVFACAPGALVLGDVEGRVLAANKAFLDLWGLPSVDAILGRDVRELDPEPGVAVDVLRGLAENGSWSGEIAARHADGRRLVVRVDAVRLAGGSPPRFVAALTDVTDLRTVESVLRELAERTATTSGTEYLHSLVAAFGRSLGVRWALVGEVDPESPGRVRVVAGIDREVPMDRFEYELEGTPCANVVGKKPCIYLEGVCDAFPEDRILLDMGAEAYLGTPLFASDGAPIGILAALHDRPLRPTPAQLSLLTVFALRAATELQRSRSEKRLIDASEALRRQTELLRQAQESARLGGWEFDHGSNRLFCTDGLQRILGADSAAVPSTLEELLSSVREEDRARVIRAFEDGVGTEEPWSVEVGPEEGAWLRITGRTVPEVGESPCTYGSVQDVSTTREMQEQLLRAQKLESIGRLAGGIAHDFNNVLTAILGAAAMAAVGVPESSQARRHLETIRVSAERASELTRQLLAFARKQIVRPERIDLAAHLPTMHRMLESVLGENVRLDVEIGESPWEVRIDPGQLEQVVLNLAVNARDAMPRGGRFRIGVSNTHATADAPSFPGGPESGDWVALRFEDSGCGIAPELQPLVFEPFFTTKPPGEGSGLGLASCHGIVRQNGGHIAFESIVGDGTSFTVLLPRDVARETATPAFVPEAGTGREAGAATVLVVEDEPILRELAADVLGAAGYRVLLAADGEDAISVSEAHEGEIELLFSDIVLPGKNGWEIAEILRASRPELRVLFSSGYADDAIGKLGVPRSRFAFLPKPYTPGTLVDRVRRALERPE